MAKLSLKSSDAKSPFQSLARRNSNPVGTTCGNQNGGYTITLSDIDNNVLMNNNAANSLNTHRKLDRSQSEPADRNSPGGHKNNINTSRYKTELCRPFEENGTCKYGDKCQFAHGIQELRSLARHPKYKTELCRTFHTIGFCPYGPRCHFIHNADEGRAKLMLAGNDGNDSVPSKYPPPSYPIRSTGDSPSPTSSLSQSPVNTQTTFFPQDLVPKFIEETPNFTPNPEFSPPIISPRCTNGFSTAPNDQTNACNNKYHKNANNVIPIKEEISSPTKVSVDMKTGGDDNVPRLPVFNHIMMSRFSIDEMA